MFVLEKHACQVTLSAFENELGVQAPVGFWDPAGFTADGSVEDFKRRRQTELKHGRISMLATMGYITPEKLVWQFQLCSREKHGDKDSRNAWKL